MANRSESTLPAGKIKAGYLVPVNAFPVEGGESAMVTQNVTMETLPIAGRLISKMRAELVNVFVPVEAMMKLKEPDDPDAGNTEVLKRRWLADEDLFPLEAESDISKYCNIQPVKVGGEFKVTSDIRLAHNAAVNFLRRSRYVYASQLLASNTAITPALLSESILSLMNGVLDPDEHINGAMNLNIPTMALPVKGIGIANQGAPATAEGSRAGYLWSDSITSSGATKTGRDGQLAAFETEGGVPKVYAHLDGLTAGGVNLTALKNAQSIDRITRFMRGMIDANPQFGEEIALRWSHNLSVDRADQPFFLYSEEEDFGLTHRKAQDGAGMVDDVEQTLPIHQRRIAFPVPRTDLGGVVVTFLAVKPDEVIDQQPHPIFTKPRKLRNHVADQLKLDPVAVLMREISANVPTASENTVAFYTGYNELLKRYVNYGWNRKTDPENLDSKNSLWQYAIPVSVTPESVIYPTELETYPWVDQSGDVVTYAIATEVAVQTPIVFGPTPVEEVEIINDEDIFED